MEQPPFVLSQRQSVANQFLLEMRDASLQQDRMRFRKNMERLGQILAYEISSRLPFEEKTVGTPLGTATLSVLREEPVLLTILRAGIPFMAGFQQVFDRADGGFIGAYRNEKQPGTVTVNLEYLAVPDIHDRHVILIDPMLATGRSVLDALSALRAFGTPAHVYIVSVVAAPEGIKLLQEKVTLPFSLWTCAVDEKLNASFYIVPGLGDAGDLSFGLKM